MKLNFFLIVEKIKFVCCFGIKFSWVWVFWYNFLLKSCLDFIVMWDWIKWYFVFKGFCFGLRNFVNLFFW